MRKSCSGPQNAALLAGFVKVSAANYYQEEALRIIDTALKQHQIDVAKAKLVEEISYESPLGNKAEDVEAWNGLINIEPSPAPGKFVTNEARAEFKFKRFLHYTLKSCSSLYSKSANYIVLKAKEAIGGGTSERQLKYDLNKLRHTGYFTIEKSETGSSHANVIKLTKLGRRIKKCIFRRKTSVCNPFYKSLKSINNNTPRRPTTSVKLKKLTFAVLQGRKPMEGFGRFYCQNDDGWKTITELHWDNCKVAFSAKILFNTVYELLEKGLKIVAILAQYQVLLEKWHGIANDNHATAIAPWKPTGLVGELRLINDLPTKI